MVNVRIFDFFFTAKALGREVILANGRMGERVKERMGDSEITNYGAGSLEKRLGDRATER